ncbi:hypothetical protein AVEN_169077-1 [Araneus ventricosus]|uniref:Uncharacterized protein n=1 Tax=Araneus ventricosus TaxID=182803 RepID=A0A4Y2PMS7_ARAVE|nr:hypothetical protein AVEN_122105-1 [Araneus ventricosus]GBN83708.1 hypothetical protein AVEN_169077-1 [Araneus ventricosus]
MWEEGGLRKKVRGIRRLALAVTDHHKTRVCCVKPQKRSSPLQKHISDLMERSQKGLKCNSYYTDYFLGTFPVHPKDIRSSASRIWESNYHTFPTYATDISAVMNRSQNDLKRKRYATDYLQNISSRKTEVLHNVLHFSK